MSARCSTCVQGREESANNRKHGPKVGDPGTSGSWQGLRGRAPNVAYSRAAKPQKETRNVRALVSAASLLLATGIVVFRKCRVSESRQYAWVPPCVFLAGFALCALSFANIYTFHKMPECFCLTFAAF